MATGNITDWNGSMLDIGPLYPFVGWEVLMVILLVIFWVWWHFTQMRMEKEADDEAARHLSQGDNLAKALEAEHVPERM